MNRASSWPLLLGVAAFLAAGIVLLCALRAHHETQAAIAEATRAVPLPTLIANAFADYSGTPISTPEDSYVPFDNESAQDYKDRVLCDACEHNDLRHVRYFVAQGADVNVVRDEGEWDESCPVSLAASPEVLKHLLSKGASLKGRAGHLALWCAAGGDRSIAQLRMLLEHGARARGKAGNNAFTVAFESGNLEKMRLLLVYGASVNARERFTRQTGLMAASYQPGGEGGPERQNLTMLKFLLARGAQVHLRDEDGKTALYYAKQFNKHNNGEEAVHLLLKAGARQ